MKSCYEDLLWILFAHVPPNQGTVRGIFSFKIKTWRNKVTNTSWSISAVINKIKNWSNTLKIKNKEKLPTIWSSLDDSLTWIPWAHCCPCFLSTGFNYFIFLTPILKKKNTLLCSLQCIWLVWVFPKLSWGSSPSGNKTTTSFWAPFISKYVTFQCFCVAL